MSWSVGISGVEQGPKGSVKEAALEQLGAMKYDVTPEVDEQVEAAAAAVEAVIASGAVGGLGKRFQVSMSGHANPEHEPASGYGNDCVSVYISQLGES
jgi:hypothetical protein